jgi:hypothetical protein
MERTPEQQAEFDFKGDWIPDEWNDDAIATCLVAAIGASPDYIARYLTTLKRRREFNLQ